MITTRTALAAMLALCLTAPPSSAQEGRRLSHCIAIADAAPGIEYIQQAAWNDAAPAGAVRINYIGHSMFLLRTEDDLTIVTDYNGWLGPTDFRPDVVTMNHAHSSHWTEAVDGIPHVLRGWSETSFGLPADHHLEIGQVLIRNVTTDIRSWGTVEEHGNSIFVFEAANLCIAHLGHLHQEPNDQQYAALGRVDVLMVPVDGSYTMNLATMMKVVDRLQSSVVIPMHWFSRSALEAFLAGMEDEFDVVRLEMPEIELGLHDLPGRPTILQLEPQYLR